MGKLCSSSPKEHLSHSATLSLPFLALPFSSSGVTSGQQPGPRLFLAGMAPLAQSGELQLRDILEPSAQAGC